MKIKTIGWLGGTIMGKRGRKWDSLDDKFLIDNFEEMKPSEIANKLNRTIAAVQARVYKLRSNGKMGEADKVWTREEEDYLITNHGTLSYSVLAKKLNKNIEQVRNKIRYLDATGKFGMTETYKNELHKQSLEAKKQREKRKVISQKELRGLLEEEKKYRDYGIGRKDLPIELSKDKTYKLKIKETGNNVRLFKGKLIQSTSHHITFINNASIRESFLRSDILRNVITIEEIKRS